MVIVTSPQVSANYILHKQFTMPLEGGGKQLAVSVPADWASKINSLYTLLVQTMILNVWCMLFAATMFVLMNRGNPRVHHLSTSLWNKRSSMMYSFVDVVSGGKDHWSKWWVYPLIIAVASCWVSQIALSVIIPSDTIIGNAAPVNPYAVYAPNNTYFSTESLYLQSFAMDDPSGLRAAGAAFVASSGTKSRVSVTNTSLGTTRAGDPITRVDYSYYVTGTDLGLQNFPSLKLNVTGACTTEYGWWEGQSNITQGGGYLYLDNYDVFNETVQVSSLDGPEPKSFFYTGPAPADTDSNQTWAAVISTRDRYSFTEGTDASYVTENATDPLSGAAFIVKGQRPVLSCWETDDWIYNGHRGTIVQLNGDDMPGFDLPDSLSQIFVRYLSVPKIVTMGSQLGPVALASSHTALGQIFDAGSNSMFNDIQRLVLAAFVATTNTLTDTTLYGTNGRELFPNIAQAAGTPLDGVGDFVVYSEDVATLSIQALIAIPVVCVVLGLLMVSLLNCSPLRRVTALDAVVLHQTITEKYPQAHPRKEGGWRTDDADDTESMMPLRDRPGLRPSHDSRRTSAQQSDLGGYTSPGGSSTAKVAPHASETNYERVDGATPAEEYDAHPHIIMEGGGRA